MGRALQRSPNPLIEAGKGGQQERGKGKELRRGEHERRGAREEGKEGSQKFLSYILKFYTEHNAVSRVFLLHDSNM